ncbi:MAG: DUF6067 family protein [Planctomycetaceae bacterium]
MSCLMTPGLWIAILAFAANVIAADDDTLRPILLIPVAHANPMLDGVIHNEEWKGAALIHGLYDPATGQRFDGVQIRVLLTPDSVYAAFRVSKLPNAGWRIAAHERDAPLWRDDAVELLLAPRDTPSPQWRFLVNTDGVLYDDRDRDATHDAEWEAAVLRDDSSWTAELRIPRRLWPEESSQRGWVANVCCYGARRAHDRCCWALLGNVTHQREALGLWLTESSDAVGSAAAISAVPAPGYAQQGAVNAARLPPLLVRRDCIESWNREHEFADALLPQQITAGGVALLTEPIQLHGKSGAKEIVWQQGSARWDSIAPFTVTRIAEAKADGLRARTHLCMEEDGCMKIELIVKAEGQWPQQLWLEIPVRGELARLIHATDASRAGSFSMSTSRLSTTWRHPFIPCLWIGDEERGITWFAESDEAVDIADGHRCLEIIREAKTTRLRVHLHDQQESGRRELRWTFGLQATPVRPLAPAQPRISMGARYGVEAQKTPDGTPSLSWLREQGVRSVIFFQDWTAQYGDAVLTPENRPRMDAMMAALKLENLGLHLYVGYGLANQSKSMRDHAEEWVVRPRISWGDPAGGPWNFDASCPRSGYTRVIEQNLARTLDQIPVSGLFFDGTALPQGCLNHAHGCGYQREGRWRKTWPIWATRDYMRRLVSLLHEKHPDAVTTAHISGSVLVPTVSCCDYLCDGEQFQSVEHGTVPLSQILRPDSFRAEFLGTPFGIRSLLLPTPGLSGSDILAFCLSHGTQPVIGSTLHARDASNWLWGFLDNIGDDAVWHPYWTQDNVTASTPNTLCSYYRGKNGALHLIIAHFGEEPVKSTITLESTVLGQVNALRTAVIWGRNRSIAVEDGKLRLDLPARGAVCLKIAAMSEDD